MLQNSVKTVLDRAFETSSAKVDKLMNQVRSEVMDEKEALNENIEKGTSLIRNALIINEEQAEKPMQAILRQIKQTLSTDPMITEKDDAKICKTLHAELLNEYTQNHKLLSAAFPYIFPLGLDEHVFGTATVPDTLQETWMSCYDHRCAEELHLIFLLFDQQKRHATNAAVAYKIKSSGEKEQRFIETVNQQNFLQELQHAISHPKSNAAKAIKKTITPLVKIVGRTVPWTFFFRM